ncbi:MAG: CBS domain-containing protein, partial [Desulfovibrionaceae bacterium]
MDVARIMNRDVVRVAPEATLGELMPLQATPTTRQLYVTEPEGRLLGIITGFDLLKHLIPGYVDPNLAKLIAADDELLADTYERTKHLT